MLSVIDRMIKHKDFGEEVKIVKAVLLHTYKALNGQAPFYLEELCALPAY